MFYVALLELALPNIKIIKPLIVLEL
jgi:hypothetical protein